jgi:hypothetical protein
MSVLREVAEALEGRVVDVQDYGDRLDLDDLRPVWLRQLSAEDVLQSLPEHLWERVTVTRVAPGRFVVEEAAPECGKPAGTRSVMVCPVCGHRATSSGALTCGPHKREDGSYGPAVRMVEGGDR